MRDAPALGTSTSFDTTGYAVNICAEVSDFNIADFIEPRRSRRMERFTQFAFAASKMALEHAGLDPKDPDPSRVGVVIGSGVGGLRLIEDDTMNLNTKGPRSVSPDLIARMMANSASGAVAIEFRISGAQRSHGHRLRSQRQRHGPGHRPHPQRPRRRRGHRRHRDPHHPAWGWPRSAPPGRCPSATTTRTTRPARST